MLPDIVRGCVCNDRAAFWVVLGVAVVARLALAFGPAPLLSDDVYRYVHDGWHAVEGVHPYAMSPTDFLDRQATDGHAPIGWSPPIDKINNPTLITIYQPTSQIVFAGLGLVSQAAWRAIDPINVFRLAFALLDVVVIALLIIALRQAGRSAWWAVLYACHPLALSETAWTGHQDVIGIACLLGALMMTARVQAAIPNEDEPGKRTRGLRLVICAGILFALAVAVKPLVLPLGLPLAWALRGRWRLIPVAAAATGIGLIAVYLPFALWPPGLGGMLETVRVFVEKWASNASLHRAAELALGEKQTADYAMTALLLAVLLVATFTTDLWRAAMVYLLAGVLVSSTAHPWYLLWALALLPLAFSWTAWVLSLSITLAYTARLNEAEFQPFRWAVWAAYVPVYAVLVWELVMWRRGAGMRRGAGVETPG